MAPKQNAAAMTRDLRHKVLSCVSRLSDKDTHSQALSDLHSIIPSLSPDTFSLFINSLSSTSSADRASVRSASLKLLSSLSSFHGAALSPHLSKLTASVVRRFRDPDSAVRAATAVAVAAFARHSLSSSASFGVILRPLADSLATEQEASAQAAAAMCVAAMVDAAEDPDVAQIVKLVPKWMKLLKSDGFKAKAAVLVVMRSVFRVCEVGNCNMLRDMVNCLVEFVKSEDWTARKAAAEALTEVAVVEREYLSEMKNSCLKTFESRKFDKVKGVREAMIQMVEAWKEVPDVFDDGSPPPQSQSSSKGMVENVSGGRCVPRSRISSVVGSNTPQSSKKHVPLKRSSPPDSSLRTTARNRGASGATEKRSSPPIFRKLDSKKFSVRNAGATGVHGSCVTPGYDDISAGDDEGNTRRVDVRTSRAESKRGLFGKNSGSRVVPYLEDGSDANGDFCNTSADTCRHQKDCEELTSIRKQLVQIEQQQSGLMDLLQKFIGTSQDGMRTLETRVHGLERALDDISYDLAVSTARMSNVEPPRASCCMLPGSDFLNSKFWRRTGGQCSTSRFSFSGSTPPVSAMRSMADKSPGGAIGLENRRFRLRGPGGVIVNPLAQLHGDSRGLSGASSNRMLKNVQPVV